MTQQDGARKSVPVGWRMFVGATLLTISLVSPIFIPLVMITGLSDEMKASFSGLLVFGIPQLITLAAIAILGKPGFQFVKGKLFAMIRRFGPRHKVGKLRYQTGLVMFCIPLIVGWVMPYLAGKLAVYNNYRIAIGIAGDLILITSLFLLGGEFWDKLRALFIFDAEARIRE